MLEPRGLVQECITRGENSIGFTEFCGLAPALKTADGAGYRFYIESIFDELSTEVKVLFDRRDPASVLWPKKATFDEILEILNGADLKEVWKEDETIGWIYQFFNSGEERRQMRDESAAPRNSRELAIRNQFFTPSYVVQFLTDNTLGRIWHKMRDGRTGLAETCEYMVKTSDGTTEPSIPAKKDPRDLRILDPACGSGHFLLYCFALLLLIYEEAWNDETSPASSATGRTLRQDYATLDALKLAMPGLILRHNLHGVDIDPRCAQIAQLALWMRAQRAFMDAKISRDERPIIRRANVVIAEPMPGDTKLVEEFSATLQPAMIGDLFKEIVSEMRLAGEMGSLLPVEQTLARSIERARVAYKEQEAQAEKFLPGLAPIKAQQELDLSGISNSAFFEQVEDKMFSALHAFVSDAVNGKGTRRRLFADDAEQGIAFIETMNRRFDVILMNPPFGDATAKAKPLLANSYSDRRVDLYKCFVERALSLAADRGCVGAITSRTGLFLGQSKNWRNKVFFSSAKPTLLADLGGGVLDAAVDTAAYVVERLDDEKDRGAPLISFRLLDANDKDLRLKDLVRNTEAADRFEVRTSDLLSLPSKQIAYWAPNDALAAFAAAPSLSDWAVVRQGLETGDDQRFVRLWWEVSPDRLLTASPGTAPAQYEQMTYTDRFWCPIAKGGASARLFVDTSFVINYRQNGRELKTSVDGKYGGSGWSRLIQSTDYYFRPGYSFGRRVRKFSPVPLPEGMIISGNSPTIYVNDAVNDAWIPEYLASDVARSLLGLITSPRKIEVGYVSNIPTPDLDAGAKRQLVGNYFTKVRGYIAQLQYDETERLFSRAPLCQADTPPLVPECNDLVASALNIGAPSVAFLLSEIGRASGLTEAEEDGDDDVGEPSEESSDDLRRLSWLVGVALGRFDIRAATPLRESPAVDPNAPLRARSPGMLQDNASAFGEGRGILADDVGHPDDIVDRIGEVCDAVQCDVGEPEQVRRTLAQEFFAQHIKMYSRSRRKAPIYWQLGTSSASYSVWLYVHRFTSDTMSIVLGEFVEPKLEHERKKLQALRSEADGAVQGQIEEQEQFVQELQGLRDEVKRVVPLWKPMLDDGIAINFAPLWRLVPQNRSLQRELKTVWEALQRGDLDWSHLAMHFWPERVVPKCAADRSLAIAHGLEDIFWLKDGEGKWTAHDKPTKSIAKLVVDRSSAGVKAALKSLIEAPDIITVTKRTRKSKAA